MILKIARRLTARMSILHVAEKNSIAKEVANVLSQSNRRTIPTLSKFNPIYEFELEDKPHRFTSVRGHIFEYELPEECKNWKAFDNKKILLSEVPMVKKLGPDMEDVVNNLNRLAKDHKELILWLDCDREGEAIAFEVIQVCTKINPRLKIKRARFSAVTPTDVWNAYNALVNPNQLQADAVNYRIEIDFRSGCTFTRYQTVVFQSYFSNQSGSFLSYGPCQMPTLNFVVQRYLQIKNFKPEKFWFIEMICVINQKTGIPFHWEKKNTRNQVEANQALYNILSGFPDGNVMAKVKDRKNSQKKKYRPYPLTTVKFQKLATDKLRISSAKAMEIAEKLYQKGFISYPRTETNAFPKTMNLKSLVQRLEGSPEFGGYVKKLLEQNKFVSPKAGSSNDEAHTPIHPVKMVQKSQLEPQLWRVYDMIVRSFLACCSADAIGQEFQVKAEVGGQGFKASYLTIKQFNYLQIYPFEKWVQTSFPADIPSQFPAMITLKDSKTTPPGYLTQSQLIDLMQKNQIGTDSTIHQHIQTIQKRQYALKSNNTLKPTNLGASLIQTYQELQISLPECQIRRKIEQKMNRIAMGEIGREVAVRETLGEMVPVYERLVQVRDEWLRLMRKFMEGNVELKRVDVQERGEQGQEGNRKMPVVACKCLKCNQGTAYLRYSQKTQSYFLGCSKYPSCRYTQSLPSYIQQVKQTGKKCPKCADGYLAEIVPRPGKIIEPLMMRLMFLEAQSGTVQVCLAPGCGTEFYSEVTQFGFSGGNTNTNTNYNTNYNTNNYTNNPSRTNTTTNNYKSASTGQNSNSLSKTKYNRSNTTFNKGSSTFDKKKEGSSTNWGGREIRCYRCNELGHIAPQCPQGQGQGGGVNRKINQFKSGFPTNARKYEKKSESEGDGNQEKGKKVCKECGVEGRHPRGSQCPSVVRKRKPKQ